MTLQRMFFRFAIGMVVVLITVGAIVVLAPKYRQTLFLRSERQRLSADCAQLELQIEDLRRRQHRFRVDPDYVEHIARLNRRVRPNEVVFVLRDNPETNP